MMTYATSYRILHAGPYNKELLYLYVCYYYGIHGFFMMFAGMCRAGLIQERFNQREPTC